MMDQTLVNIIVFLIILPMIGLVILKLLEGKPKSTCRYCGQQVSGRLVVFSDGLNACTKCFQQILDRQGVCPICNKPIDAAEETSSESGKWCHSTCLAMMAHKEEGMSRSQVALLGNAVKVLFSIPSLEDTYEISPDVAKETVQKLYLQFPKTVKRFLLSWAVNIPKTNVLVNALLQSMSINCPSCHELVPEKIEKCPHCSIELRKTAKEVVKAKKVIVKIRCRYCSNIYDETLDKCPHCGGSR